MKSEEKLDQCYEAVKDQLPFVPKLALILGSERPTIQSHTHFTKKTQTFRNFITLFI